MKREGSDQSSDDKGRDGVGREENIKGEDAEDGRGRWREME